MVNRLQKVLEWAKIKLGNVVTDLTGVSPRRMLQGIVEGQTNVQDLAALAKGSLSRKQEQLQQALQGQVRDHHRFLIQQHLTHLEFLEAQIAQFNQQIEQSIEVETIQN